MHPKEAKFRFKRLLSVDRNRRRRDYRPKNSPVLCFTNQVDEDANDAIRSKTIANAWRL